MEYRIEKDSIGDVKVPSRMYYGAQTQRAVDNFLISGRTLPVGMVRAAATIKKAAAIVHGELGLIGKDVAQAICSAAERVIAGELDEHFVVDIYQAGAGTSFHMNINEVIANLAEESLGGQRGKYERVNPNDHVNMGQSTNDVIPTTIRLACLSAGRDLIPAINDLAGAFDERAEKFRDIVTTGRTHLQDAVPIKLGQEFGGWAQTIRKQARRLSTSFNRAGVLGLGGSAAGTGLNAHPEYQQRVVGVLRQLTGFDLSADVNLFAAMSSMDVFADIAARMKGTSLELLRISNDLRLLSSGPTSGLAEIKLPELQPGSSIMPGKVNPVMPEMTAMVAFQVIGYETTVSMAAQAGQLQLNVMMPVIGYSLLEAVRILTNCAVHLNQKCVAGIEADQQRCRMYFETSLGTATVLNPVIGYLNTAKVVKESLKTGRSLKEIVLERGILTEDELKQALDPERITVPGMLKKE